MATSAQGTVLRITPAGKDPVAVGRLTSVGEISPDSEAIDVTTLDSEGGCREYMQGFRDAGEVEVSGFFDAGDDGQAALREAYASGAVCGVEVAFPDGSAAVFSAFVRSHSVGAAEVDGAVGFGAVLRVTGGVAVTA